MVRRLTPEILHKPGGPKVAHIGVAHIGPANPAKSSTGPQFPGGVPLNSGYVCAVQRPAGRHVALPADGLLV